MTNAAKRKLALSLLHADTESAVTEILREHDL